MMGPVLTLNKYVLYYTKKLAEGITEEQLRDQVAPGMNTPGWILGHLAIAYGYGIKMLGGTPPTPGEWPRLFGPGSNPTALPTPMPTKQQLLDAIEAGNTMLGELVKSAPPEKLASPHSFEPMKDATPTLGDFLAHLMTTHPVSHLGQLSAWRRLRGLPAVLGF